MEQSDSHRRTLLKAASAAFTTALFTGQVKGANDRVAAAFIGMGRMGNSNMSAAMRQPGLAVTAVCDVYQPHLERAAALARRRGHQPRELKDFREILRDPSIDVVNISTPDHWHALMTVEACKAGKDVYVEKPVSVYYDEGAKMVAAARKYQRVVQVGTQQRSGVHFQEAADIVRSGELGEITACRTWNYSNARREGIGTPGDSAPPPGLDWDFWLGPAPERPFNQNRFGVDPNAFSHFRWFWDYAGGMMTDWGVHLLDIVQMAFGETMPRTVTAVGANLWLQDNRETPDTLVVTSEYPGFLATYENRNGNAQSMFGHSYGVLFHGSKGTLFVDRAGYEVLPEGRSDVQARSAASSNNSNLAHWENFLECVRTRQRPVSDIEIGFRSTATCLLGNVALRSKLRIDWDEANGTTAQPEARRWLSAPYRSPWKLEV
jgi:predicted dehydrogenase